MSDSGDSLPISPAPAALCRHLLAAVLIAAAVLLARAVIIVNQHSTCLDDNYHLYRGLLALRGQWTQMRDLDLNTPIVAEEISAIPAWLNGVEMKDSNLNPQTDVPPPYCFVLNDRIRLEIALWKSLLFLLAIAVLFLWIKSIYSISSAWLAVAMVLIEPTFAAHLPLPTVDVLSAQAILIAAWASWRFILQPKFGRLALAAVMTALAMGMKQSGLILPPVMIALAAWHWLVREKLWRRPRELVGNVGLILVGAMIASLSIWACYGFQISVPAPIGFRQPLFGEETLDRFALPGGLYISSVFTALAHMRDGHRNFLWGQMQWQGWWYYFLVLASYKIPIGIFAVMAMGVVSLFWIKPRYGELPLLVCAAAWGGAAMMQSIDIGFRHFLPCEIFALMLASRCLAVRLVAANILAWIAVAVAAIDVAAWTPDYFSYVNFPRKDIWMQISDSNLDWGQGRRELRHWLDNLRADGRPVYYGYFGPPDLNLFDELGPRLTQYVSCTHWLHRPDASASDPDLLPDKNVIPDHGILILSAVALSGQYDLQDRFAPLREAHIEPDETISNYLLVYDLDRLRALGKLPGHTPPAKTP